MSLPDLKIEELSEMYLRIDAIEAILDGIDRTETDDEEGWWETDTGAEFGREILLRLRKNCLKLGDFKHISEYK